MAGASISTLAMPGILARRPRRRDTGLVVRGPVAFSRHRHTGCQGYSMCRAVAAATSGPSSLATTCSDMSMPAATPADVMTRPLSTIAQIVAHGGERRRPRAADRARRDAWWPTDCRAGRPWPTAARRCRPTAPARPAAARCLIQSITVASCIRGRVPVAAGNQQQVDRRSIGQRRLGD